MTIAIIEENWISMSTCYDHTNIAWLACAFSSFLRQHSNDWIRSHLICIGIDNLFLFLWFSDEESTNRRCLIVSEQISRNVLSERLLYLTRYQSKLKHTVFTLVLLLTPSFVKTPKMTPESSRNWRHKITWNVSANGMHNKWFEWLLISKAAKQANLHHFQNSWMFHVAIPNNHHTEEKKAKFGEKSPDNLWPGKPKRTLTVFR